MEIIFTNTLDVHQAYAPTPASSCVPEWYRDMESYVNGVKKPNGEGKNTGTIKRCMPVFDAITCGYILYTPTDVYVSQRPTLDTQGNDTGKTAPWYEWPSLEQIAFHPYIQAPHHPNKGGLSEDGLYPKWVNPWSIKTPKGYSALFTQPMHRESPFTILDGIVDTDTYYAPVNFPFVLNDWNFEGLIPAGTPMAQVIPFKRDSWTMKLGDETERNSQSKVSSYLRSSFFDSYKNKFRQPKHYR